LSLPVTHDSLAPGRPRAGEAGVSLPLACLYAALVGGFPLASLVPEVLGLPAGAFTVGFRALVLWLCAACLLGWLYRRRPIHGGPLVWAALALFWFVLMLRLVVDAGTPSMPLPRAPAEYALFAVGICLVPMVAMFEIPTRATLRLAWALSLGVVALASLGLLWLLGSGAITVFWDSRVSTEVLNPISVGYLGASLVVLCLARPFHLPGELPGSAALRGCAWFVLGAAGAGLAVASGSRGPLLALALVVAAWLVLSPVQRRHRGWRIAARLAFALLVAAAVAVAAIVVTDLLGVNPFERFLWLLEDDSVGYRRQALAGSLAQFASSPWVGDALIERSTLDYPHNIYVESLMSVGLVGTAGLLVFTLATVRASLTLLRRDVSAAWVGMLSLLHVFASLTSGALYLSDAFWTLGAASIAAASGRPFLVLAHRGLVDAASRASAIAAR
jgi:hypothetical protein